MTGLVKKTVLGAAMIASTLAATAPAEAQYRGYRGHRGGDTTGAAILGGIVGLGVGAAIASSGNRHRYDDRYYDRGYNRGYYNDGYYAQPNGYYYNDYRYNYRPRCYIERQYDRWSGRPYDVRVCN